MATIKLMTAEVNGKKIGFSSETEFLVQVSRNRNSKSGYETKYSFTGAEFSKAAFYYQGINIGNGYRKRILMAGKVLIRQR